LFLGENSRGSPYCGNILIDKKRKTNFTMGQKAPKKKEVKKLYSARLEPWLCWLLRAYTIAALLYENFFPSTQRGK
jgi:hypothetical protein